MTSKIHYSPHKKTHEWGSLLNLIVQSPISIKFRHSSNLHAIQDEKGSFTGNTFCKKQLPIPSKHSLRPLIKECFARNRLQASIWRNYFRISSCAASTSLMRNAPEIPEFRRSAAFDALRSNWRDRQAGSSAARARTANFGVRQWTDANIEPTVHVKHHLLATDVTESHLHINDAR